MRRGRWGDPLRPRWDTPYWADCHRVYSCSCGGRPPASLNFADSTHPYQLSLFLPNAAFQGRGRLTDLPSIEFGVGETSHLRGFDCFIDWAHFFGEVVDEDRKSYAVGLYLVILPFFGRFLLGSDGPVEALDLIVFCLADALNGVCGTSAWRVISIVMLWCGSMNPRSGLSR